MAITFLFPQKDSKQNRSMKVLEILFWISLFIVFYTYRLWYIIIYSGQDKRVLPHTYPLAYAHRQRIAPIDSVYRRL